MSAQPVRDPLRGMSIEEAQSEYLRLCFRAEQLTTSLRQIVMTSVVRANVERERDSAERDAFDLACCIRDAESEQRTRGGT